MSLWKKNEIASSGWRSALVGRDETKKVVTTMEKCRGKTCSKIIGD